MRDSRLEPEGFIHHLRYYISEKILGRNEKVKITLERAKEALKNRQEIQLVMMDASLRDMVFHVGKGHDIDYKGDDPDLIVSGERLIGNFVFRIKVDPSNAEKILDAMEGKKILTLSSLNKRLEMEYYNTIRQFFRKVTPKEVFNPDNEKKLIKHVNSMLKYELQDTLGSFGLSIDKVIPTIKVPRNISHLRRTAREVKNIELNWLRKIKKKSKYLEMKNLDRMETWRKVIEGKQDINNIRLELLKLKGDRVKLMDVINKLNEKMILQLKEKSDQQLEYLKNKIQYQKSKRDMYIREKLEKKETISKAKLESFKIKMDAIEEKYRMEIEHKLALYRIDVNYKREKMSWKVIDDTNKTLYYEDMIKNAMKRKMIEDEYINKALENYSKLRNGYLDLIEKMKKKLDGEIKGHQDQINSYYDDIDQILKDVDKPIDL